MLSTLNLNNFPTGYNLSSYDLDGCFVMPTCQRTLVLSYGNNPFNRSKDSNLILNGVEAYQYLLEIICGLQSKLIGENEIKNQFKVAFQDFLKTNSKSHLTTIIEKLFRDAKKIRSEHLMGLSQKTYSSIARKKILQTGPVQKVLIIGSGNLAEDLINQFKKKSEVIICARNSQRVSELMEQHLNVSSMDWKYLKDFTNFSHVVNTVGVSDQLISEDLFEKWDKLHTKNLFIDLASPSIYKFESIKLSSLINLDNVLDSGAIEQDHKNKKIENARIALIELAERRARLLKTKLHNKTNRTNQAYV
jgi:glutamyl-tRNA reductase